MKMSLITLLLCSPLIILAHTDNEACKIMKNRLIVMNAVAGNIANNSTTRIPAGGPYRKKEIVCINENCKVKEVLSVINKYQPEHLDADQNGYVTFPDIDLQIEMEKMVTAQNEYTIASVNCKNKDIK